MNEPIIILFIPLSELSGNVGEPPDGVPTKRRSPLSAVASMPLERVTHYNRGTCLHFKLGPSIGDSHIFMFFDLLDNYAGRGFIFHLLKYNNISPFKI